MYMNNLFSCKPYIAIFSYIVMKIWASSTNNYHNLQLPHYNIRIALIFMSIVLSQFNLTASDNIVSMKLQFDENDFILSTNELGQIEIESKIPSSYPENEAPGLPLLATSVIIDANTDYVSSNVVIKKKILKSNVIVEPAPLPVKISDTLYDSVNHKKTYYTNDIYPDNSCKYITTSHWKDFNVMHFLTCPFIYDSTNKILYFIESMELDIELSGTQSNKNLEHNIITSTMIKSFVKNSDAIDISGIERAMPKSSDEKIDYIIITNKELKSSFEPLAIWKTTKGIKTSIITIDEIASKYTGTDEQVKIKKCIYDLFENNSLKYVLLGGDDKIVPVRGCYGKITNSTTDKTIPTDLYYACFSGDFEWDGNHNNIFGEIDDNIDLAQSVFVSRAPVKTKYDTDAFVNRVISYEKEPLYNDNILMCAKNSFAKDTIEFEIGSNSLYTKYIKPYWNGMMYRFHESASDFDTTSKYEFNPNNLKNQLAKGYSFVNVNLHGLQTYWDMESYGHYTSAHGKSQSNVAHTIITTIACFTNAFDISSHGSEDPCLSESFIRNPTSGVVAYLGCSRYSWGTSKGLGASHDYNAQFYKNLFSDTFEDKNFGVIVAAAKSAKIASCGNYNTYRWIQFGLNPIGDPEMPIFISTPKKFDDVKFACGMTGLSIDTGVDNCRICVTDEVDHGEGYFEVFDNVQCVTTSNLPDECTICITKQGYIPKLFSLRVLQNKTIKGNNNFDYDIVMLGASATTFLKSGETIIKDGQTKVNATEIYLGPGTTIEKGAQLILTTKNQ